jgi:hypothetical protein
MLYSVWQVIIYVMQRGLVKINTTHLGLQLGECEALFTAFIIYVYTWMYD